MGINEAVIRQIALSNKEPDWMLEHRLKSLRAFENFAVPTW